MPSRETVIPLPRRKALLRERIAQRRLDSVAAARRIIRPLSWIDRAQLLYRQLPFPVRLAGLEAGFVLWRNLFPKATHVWRWAPLFAGAWRILRASPRPSADSAGA